MKITTVDGLAGRITEETLGVVRGTALWAHRITKFSYGGIRHFHASGCQELDEGLKAAKEAVTKEMAAQAEKMGADAIVGMRLEVVEMSNGTFCVNATGTAVKTMKLPQTVPSYVAARPEEFIAGMAAIAVRPSFHGSTLRH